MRFGSLAQCSAGAVAAMTAMVLPVLLGFAALGTEVGHWYLVQREMQGAADAAAISATAEFVHQYNSGNPTSTSYQTVGQSYAGLNGFTIPISNVCLVPISGGDNCGTVRVLDTRPIICQTPPCIVVEITAHTLQWLTTKASVEPNGLGQVKGIPTPILQARAVVSAKSQLETVTSDGTDCVLALANDPKAIFVHGNGDPQAQCGFAIDGGVDQNPGTPVQGGITFSGAPSKVNIVSLVIAAKTANCPDGGAHCQLFGSSAALPASAVKTNTPTPDPYASQISQLFQTPPPSGVNGVALKTAGTGYTGRTCTFTVNGGTFYGAPSTPATFTATVSTSGATKGQVIAVGSVIDPGAYTGLPTGSVSATSNCGGSGATFTLTEGCFTWKGTAIAGRKYCSINLNGAGTTNFPTGSYWIAGGDANCMGFCVSSKNATATSDAAGVTFFLTNGEGTGTYGTGSYATVAITSGTVSLCAPGTNCGTTCTNNTPTSCLLMIQNPAATVSTALDAPAGTGGTASPNTVNSFSGNGNRTLSGLVYLPRQSFSETGNGPILGCVGLIAKYIDIGGTPTFSDGCLPGSGIGGTTTTTTTLMNPHLSQ